MNDDSTNARDVLTNSMLELSENMTPIFDAADGVKAEMERRGWSPTASEQVALTWLMGALAKVRE